MAGEKDKLWDLRRLKICSLCTLSGKDKSLASGTKCESSGLVHTWLQRYPGYRDILKACGICDDLHKVVCYFGRLLSHSVGCSTIWGGNKADSVTSECWHGSCYDKSVIFCSKCMETTHFPLLSILFWHPPSLLKSVCTYFKSLFPS